MHFANDSHKLNEIFNGDDKAILRKIDQEIKLVDNQTFEFPYNAWKKKQINLESKLILQAFLLHLKGYPSFILKGAEDRLHYIKNGKLFIVNSGTSIEINFEEILSKHIELFFYPQAFFLQKRPAFFISFSYWQCTNILSISKYCVQEVKETFSRSKDYDIRGPF